MKSFRKICKYCPQSAVCAVQGCEPAWACIVVQKRVGRCHPTTCMSTASNEVPLRVKTEVFLVPPEGVPVDDAGVAHYIYDRAAEHCRSD